MNVLDLNDKDGYIEAVKKYGRKWMLSALHQRGLKEGRKYRTDDELAAILYNFARLHNGGN